MTRKNTAHNNRHLACNGCQVPAEAREFYIPVLKIIVVQVPLISSGKTLFIKLPYFLSLPEDMFIDF